MTKSPAGTVITSNSRLRKSAAGGNHLQIPAQSKSLINKNYYGPSSSQTLHQKLEAD
jgi:hypothetical protein